MCTMRTSYQVCEKGIIRGNCMDFQIYGPKKKVSFTSTFSECFQSALVQQSPPKMRNDFQTYVILKITEEGSGTCKQGMSFNKHLHHLDHCNKTEGGHHGAKG